MVQLALSGTVRPQCFTIRRGFALTAFCHGNQKECAGMHTAIVHDISIALHRKGTRGEDRLSTDGVWCLDHGSELFSHRPQDVTECIHGILLRWRKGASEWLRRTD